jgi:hypothetical protein
VNIFGLDIKSMKGLLAMQVASLTVNSAEMPIERALAMQHALLSALLPFLRDLSLSKLQSERQLGFQVTLPALCSLLGPSLHHEQLARQLIDILSAAGQSSDEGMR